MGIIMPEPCESCGQMQDPLGVECDYCGSVHDYDRFSGIAIIFSRTTGESEDCDHDCNECTGENADYSEFHFCNIRCLVEQLSDPTKEDFFMRDTHVMVIYVNPPHQEDVLSNFRR